MFKDLKGFSLGPRNLVPVNWCHHLLSRTFCFFISFSITVCQQSWSEAKLEFCWCLWPGPWITGNNTTASLRAFASLSNKWQGTVSLFSLKKQQQFCAVRCLIIYRNVCPNVHNASETTRQMVSLSSFLIISIISMVDKITDQRKMLLTCLFVFACTKEETNLHHHHFTFIACTPTEHSSQSYAMD